MNPGLSRIAGLRDRDLLAEGLVVAEGRLLAGRLLAACAPMPAPAPAQGPAPAPARRRAGPGDPPGPPEPSPSGGLPRPAFEALGLACVPSLAAAFEALSAGLCPVEVLPEPELAALAGFPFHRGVLAWARRLPVEDFDAAWLQDDRGGPGGAGSPKRLVLLPATTDPENLGAIMRSAAALGWDGILLGEGSCDHLSRRAVRVSMGAAFSLPVLPLRGPSTLDLLSRASWRIVASVLDGGAADLRHEKPEARLALLIGNEYAGLGPEWLGPGVRKVTIPMKPGSDSLNAAQAAALFLWALAPE